MQISDVDLSLCARFILAILRKWFSTIISCFVFQLAREDKFFEATIGESRVRLYVQDALALGVIQNEIRADYGEIYL